MNRRTTMRGFPLQDEGPGMNELFHDLQVEQEERKAAARERWDINGFNLAEVIVVRDGPDAQGHQYVDGRHQVSIAKFETADEARKFCDQHNAGLVT
jgi:hypothetical protein